MKFGEKNLNCLTALKIASPTIFIKRTIALSNPFNINYHISSDTDFNMRISKKKLNYIYLNEFIILMKTGGLSTNFKFVLSKIMQDILILRKHFSLEIKYLLKVEPNQREWIQLVLHVKWNHWGPEKY